MTTIPFATPHVEAILPPHVDASSAPTDADEQSLYEQYLRVSAWDTNVRAGWLPIGYGRKRMIEPIE